MDLSGDSKGMVAVMDTLIFLVIMSMVVIGIFSYTVIQETEQPLAKTINDDFFSIRLKASDIFPTDDCQTYPIADLVAADLNSGLHGNAEKYVKGTMDSMVPEIYGYTFTLTYGENTMSVSRGGGDMTSCFSTVIQIDGGGNLSADLTIF
ncbi:MAG: hypothetical protein WCR83_01560 [Candidatus Methanomethylophilaceae archaeon]